MQVRDLGRMEYGECLALQRHLRDERIAGRGQDAILLVEHPAVATLGRRGQASDVFDATLPVFSIERGGKATLHGPGQLVIYPILHLGEGNRDVRAWVQCIERFAMDLLAHFGIETEIRPDSPGVWTTRSGKKIASIGVAIQHWVSTHGLALNVTIAPAEFERIDPCGLGAAVMTNMAQEGSTAALDDVRTFARQIAVEHFSSFLKNGKHS